MTSRIFDQARDETARQCAQLGVYDLRAYSVLRLVEESAFLMELARAERAYSDALRDIEASLLDGAFSDFRLPSDRSDRLFPVIRLRVRCWGGGGGRGA